MLIISILKNRPLKGKKITTKSRGYIIATAFMVYGMCAADAVYRVPTVNDNALKM